MPVVAITAADLRGGEPHVLATPVGNVLLEIQGELNLPLEADESGRFGVRGGKETVQFGRLELEGTNATLYIGTSQRLVGKVVPLDPPVAVVRFPESDADGAEVALSDVIRQKVTFKHRPLPIM